MTDSSIFGYTQPTNPANSGDFWTPGDNRLPRVLGFQRRKPLNAASSASKGTKSPSKRKPTKKK